MKVIKSFNLDTKDIGSGGEVRVLTINADKGAVFSMEIMNEDNKYYNFQTNSFQTTKTRLSDISIQNTLRRSILFPSVTDADKYDIYVFAGKNTKHTERKEVRFADGRLDINSSTGSNSKLLQKVIYQTLDTTITISGYSPNSTVTGANTVPTITASNGKSVAKIPFTYVFTVSSTRTLSINRQPISSDIMQFVDKVVDATPVDIPGEDIYPTVTGTDSVAAEVSESTSITMENPVASTMSVGDKVTGTGIPTTSTVTVASIDSTRVFSTSEAVSLTESVELNFSNRRNYRWAINDIYGLKPGMIQLKSTFFETQPTIKEYLTQTTIFENEIGEYKVDDVRIPAIDTLGAKPSMIRDATTFVETITQTGNVVFSEQALLTFAGSNGKIFAYGKSEINRLTGYDVEFSDLAVALTEVSTTTTAAVSASKSVPITQRAGIMDGISTVSGIGIDTTIASTDTVDGTVSTATKLVMDTNVASIMSVGDRVTGTGISSTSVVTVAALNPDNDNLKEFSVSEAISVADGVTLSFNSQENTIPKVVSGAGSVIGAGTLVLSSVQTLEDGITLTFPGAGTIATVTGYIKVNRAGSKDVTLRFDLEKFLTMH